MEEIPESFYKKNIVQCPKIKQPSYWKKAFELAEIPNVVSNNDDYVVIEYFVNNLAMLNDVDGRKKYRYLVPLYKCVLSLSHGNSAPENGFSINKRIIDIHGNSIKGNH